MAGKTVTEAHLGRNLRKSDLNYVTDGIYGKKNLGCGQDLKGTYLHTMKITVLLEAWVETDF